MKKKAKRLVLSKETVKMLDQGGLVKAIGGSNTCVFGCASSNPVTDACCREH